MEVASKNRLQFVHHDNVFETRDAAIEYVSNIDKGDKYGRPALFAEPMVLKYGDAENPNIILAIGSVGDGETKSITNKTYFIDFSRHEEEINEIASNTAKTVNDLSVLSGLVANIVEACGLDENGTYVSYDNSIILDAANISDAINKIADYVVELEKRVAFNVGDTTTVKLNLNTDSEKGSYLTADVKVPMSHDFDSAHDLANGIVVVESKDDGDGIFMNVDLKYDGNGQPLQLLVNGKVVRTIQTPLEVHAESGSYNAEKETLVISLSNGESIEIDLKKLAGELTVDKKQTTPIHLYRNRIKSQEDEDGEVTFHSILSADVQIAKFPNNILEVVNPGESNAALFVKGTSDNIMHGDATVKDALDKLNEGLSAEIQTRIDKDKKLKENINSVDEKVDALDEELNQKINDEKVLREQKDTILDKQIDGLEEKISAVDSDLQVEKVTVRELIAKGNAKNTLKVHPLQESNSSLGLKVYNNENETLIEGWALVDKDGKNIIQGGGKDGNALFAEVGLEYSEKTNELRFLTSAVDKKSKIITLNNASLEYDDTRNVLTYVSTLGEKKEMQLNSFSTIDGMYYNQDTEILTITYIDLSGKQQKIEIPIKDFLDEWSTEDTATVELQKIRNHKYNKDFLYANVKVAQDYGHTDNMLVETDGGLYVSASGVSANAKAIADEIERAKDAEKTLSENVASLDSRMKDAEDKLVIITSSDKEQEGSIANAIQQSKEYTDQEIKNATLSGSDAIKISDKVVSLVINEDEKYLQITNEGLKTVGIDDALNNVLSSVTNYVDGKISAVTLTAGSAITIDEENKINVQICDHDQENYLRMHTDGLVVDGIDAAIDSAVSGKANSVDVYSKTESDEIFVNKENYDSDVQTITSYINDNKTAIETNAEAIKLLNENKLVSGSVDYKIDIAINNLSAATNQAISNVTLTAGSAITIDADNKINVQICNHEGQENYLRMHDDGLVVDGIDSAIESKIVALDDKFITIVESRSDDEKVLSDAKDYSDSLKLNGSDAISVEYDDKNIVSLKINEYKNTEGYLQVNKDGIWVSGINEKVETSISNLSASTDAKLDTIELEKESDLTYILKVGDKKAGEINIPKDQFLKDVSYENGKLTFVFEVKDGEKAQKDVTVDISELIDKYTATSGITVNDEKQFSIKLSSAEKYLEISESQQLVSKGIDDAIANAVNAIEVHTGKAVEVDGEHNVNLRLCELPETQQYLFIHEDDNALGISGINAAIDSKVSGATSGIVGNVYTKSEVDTLLSYKADKSSVYTKDEVYSKSEADSIFATKVELNGLRDVVNNNTTLIEKLSGETKRDFEKVYDTIERTSAYTINLIDRLSGSTIELVKETSGKTVEIIKEVSASTKEYIDKQIGSAMSGATLVGSETIEIVDGVVKVKYDSKDKYLTVGSNGLETKGIDEAIDSAVSGITIKVDDLSGKTIALSGLVNDIKSDVKVVSGTANEALDLANRIKTTYAWIANDTPTVDLTKSESTNSGFTLTADVKLSTTNGNIITADTTGIYAKSSDLTYDTGSNTLTFTDANGEIKKIVLNSVSTIENIDVIEKDGTTYLQFLYNGDKKILINAADFFKGIVGTSDGNVKVTTALTTDQGSTSTGITANLDVNDIIDNTNTNITLTKVSESVNKINANINVDDIITNEYDATPDNFAMVYLKATDGNKITARVGISTLEGNGLVVDNNHDLYVKTTNDNLEKIIGIENGDYELIHYLIKTNFLRNITSIINALIYLDELIYNLSGEVIDLQSKIGFEVIDTNTVDLTKVVNDDDRTTLKADVKLSQKKFPGTNELINLLRIEDDGIMFDGNIDCGEY